MNEKDKKIVSICFAKGNVHNFTFFKNTTRQLSTSLHFCG